MATIIQNVNLANTFGEWVNITNEAVTAYNTLYASDFTKPTGTLYLTSPGTALAVANTAAFTGLVDISGQGSLLVRTNAEVQNTIFLTNKAGGGVNSLVLSANGVANINYVNIVGTGLAANVSNNMSIGGTLVVTGNTSTSANLVVSKDITGNNQTILYDLNVGEDVTVGNKLTVTNSTTLYQDVSAKQNLEVVHNIYSGSLQANTAANTRTLSVTGTGFVKVLQANSAINTAFISVTDTANVNLLNSNTNIIANTGSIFAANVVTPNVYFNGSIQGTGPISTTSSGSFGELTVSGDFAINGATIYAANTFTLSDGSPFPSSTSVQYGSLRVSRDSANAELRWDNSNKYWSIRDVDNGITGGWYNRVLTSNDYTLLSTSTSTANTNMKNYVDTNVSILQTQITSNSISANAVITTANTNMKNYVDTSVTTANTNLRLYTNSIVSANAVSANAVITTANTSMKNYVDNAFLKVVYGSQTVNSDLTINGNLTISGTTTTVNASTIETSDSLLKLAKNNGSSDVIDIGFYAPYQTGGATRYTGLFRKSADKYYLAQSIVADPTTNSIANYGVNYRATLDANFTGGTVSGLSAVISISDGGTNSSSTPTSGGISYGDGSKYNFTSAGTSGYVLTSAGSSAPTWTNTTNLNSANAIVKRDGSGNFSAGTITATFAGNADTVTNGVYTIGNQTIAGTKTFSSQIIGSISGNAGTATRSGYFDSQSHPGTYWLTNTWDGAYWSITSNHGSAVKVGYASSAGNASNANTAGSASSATNATNATYAVTRATGTNDTTIATTAFVNASDALLTTAKGYVSFYPATGVIYAQKNLSVGGSGGQFTIYLDPSIRNGTVNYAPIVSAIGRGTTNAMGPGPYSMDVHSIGITSVGTDSFTVVATRNYDGGIGFYGGGNDGNNVHHFAAGLLNPIRITVVVF